MMAIAAYKVGQESVVDTLDGTVNFDPFHGTRISDTPKYFTPNSSWLIMSLCRTDEVISIKLSLESWVKYSLAVHLGEASRRWLSGQTSLVR
jgi:hypothetical protein